MTERSLSQHDVHGIMETLLLYIPVASVLSKAICVSVK